MYASLDEEIAVSLACNTKSPVCIAETCHRRIRHPSGKESEAVDELIHKGIRGDNPLLHQDDPVVANVFLEVDVRTGDHQVIGPILPLVVNGEALTLQIRPTALRHPVSGDREFDQPDPSQNLVKTVAVERREGMLVVGKMFGNLVHLGCLIHRTADEEDPFSHSRPLQSFTIKRTKKELSFMVSTYHILRRRLTQIIVHFHRTRPKRQDILFWYESVNFFLLLRINQHSLCRYVMPDFSPCIKKIGILVASTSGEQHKVLDIVHVPTQ
jgi:hypothetical protein